MDRQEPRHPINYVARRSGLTTHAIRVWERRYGAVTPTRTGTNRRLYSDADIDRLRLLKIVTGAGHSIGHIATLPEQELRALASAHVEPEMEPSAFCASPEAILERCQDAVRAMDAKALEDTLLETSVALTQLRALEEVVGPLMHWVGDEWHAGTLRIAHEHLASAAVRNFLSNLRATFDRSGPGPAIVICTPSGQGHEIGAQLAACVAAMEGWRDVYFGANLPVADIARAALDTRARVVGLSIVFLSEGHALLRELTDLRRVLPERTELVVGGAAVQHHRGAIEVAGIRCVDSLSHFREVLRELALPAGAASKP